MEINKNNLNSIKNRKNWKSPEIIILNKNKTRWGIEYDPPEDSDFNCS